MSVLVLLSKFSGYFISFCVLVQDVGKLDEIAIGQNFITIFGDEYGMLELSG